MGLDDALIFTRVVECHSFTQAAQVMGMQKSTVSRRIALLEERLGVRLLNRTCLLYTSPSPRDRQKSRMPSSA